MPTPKYLSHAFVPSSVLFIRQGAGDSLTVLGHPNHFSVQAAESFPPHLEQLSQPHYSVHEFSSGQILRIQTWLDLLPDSAARLPQPCSTSHG